MKLEGNKIKIWTKRATKRELKLIETAGAHIKNMINAIKNTRKTKKFGVIIIKYMITVLGVMSIRSSIVVNMIKK